LVGIEKPEEVEIPKGARVCKLIVEDLESKIKKFDKDAEVTEAYYKSWYDMYKVCDITYRYGGEERKLVVRMGHGDARIVFSTYFGLPSTYLSERETSAYFSEYEVNQIFRRQTRSIPLYEDVDMEELSKMLGNVLPVTPSEANEFIYSDMPRVSGILEYLFEVDRELEHHERTKSEYGKYADKIRELINKVAKEKFNVTLEEAHRGINMEKVLDILRKSMTGRDLIVVKIR